ncbi:hypothetical protein E3J79_04200 [Candidatus Dependentiae bacterium]|nr:MAG: hypothetical protein E3J79_04200 [Candidatus Dependentiae bacterium]
MNRLILNRKIIRVALSITLLTNIHKSFPLSSTVEMCARFAGKSLAAATIIGIVSLPFFIKNKDKNSKTIKKQSLIKMLQVALLGGIGNTAFSLLSGKEKTSLLEENKEIELQPLPAKVDTDTKTISGSHPLNNLLGTAVFTGLGSFCTVAFSRLASPFKKSKKTSEQPNLETRIKMIEQRIQEKNAVYRETSMHVLDAFIVSMVKKLTGNETEIKGITFEEFSIRLACLTEKFKEFEPKFKKIVDNFCADIRRSSPDDTTNLASQLATFSLQLKVLENDISEIKAIPK